MVSDVADLQVGPFSQHSAAILTFHSVEDANNALELVLKKGFKLHMPSFGKGKKTVEKKVPRRGYVTHCFPVEDLVRRSKDDQPVRLLTLFLNSTGKI